MRTSNCLLLLACLATAAAFAASDRDNDALGRARQLQLEFRLGNLQVADPLVADLEAAVARSPDNADLWEALGNAYMSKQGALSASAWDPPALIAAGDRAREAFARALSMDKKNALLLASHGMAGAATALFKQDSATLMASVEEMNAAVRQAPNSTPVRLTRGFTIIHLPPAIRDTAAVTEDLKFVLNTAPGGRPEDVLHVLLGDVHAEVGDFAAARAEYAQVTGASRLAADEVKSRLRELEKGAVSPASITRVRAGTGNQCVMCHAPGSDN
jgi:hypothetical protein